MAKSYKRFISITIKLPVDINEKLISKAISEGYSRSEAILWLIRGYADDDTLIQENK